MRARDKSATHDACVCRKTFSRGGGHQQNGRSAVGHCGCCGDHTAPIATDIPPSTTAAATATTATRLSRGIHGCSECSICSSCRRRLSDRISLFDYSGRDGHGSSDQPLVDRRHRRSPISASFLALCIQFLQRRPA